MSWTCKCCTVIFAERADFDRHRTDCIKRGSVCGKCLDAFTPAGLTAHLDKSVCGLRSYNVKDLYIWAKEVNDQRVMVLVKEYHRNILNAVANGRFRTHLNFVCADNNPDVRQRILARVIEELKCLFVDVEIKPDDTGKRIDVAWTKDIFIKVKIRDDYSSAWSIAEEEGLEKPRIGLKGRTPKKITSLINCDDVVPEYDWATAVKKGASEETKRSIWEKHIGSKLPVSDEE